MSSGGKHVDVVFDVYCDVSIKNAKRFKMLSTSDDKQHKNILSDYTVKSGNKLFSVTANTPDGTSMIVVQEGVEHRTGIAEVTGSNPVEVLIFSGFFFPIAQIGKLTVMIILHFHLQPQFKYELFQIYFTQ